MKNYNVGIIGYSWAAGAHIEAINKTTNAQVTALCSSRKLDSAKISEKHGGTIKCYTDLANMLADPTLHVISICSYPADHAKQAIMSARAGKHLIIEKPLALKWEDCLAIEEAVRKAGVKTCVCFECRYSSQLLTIKAIIDQGLIGDIYFAECDYFHGIGPWYKQFEWNIKKEMGGSSLLTAGCHALDILLWLVGEEVDEVFSYSTMNPHEVYKPYEYDTTSLTILKFKNSRCVGKVASVIDCMQPYVFNMNIVGSHGSIKNDLFYSKKIEGLIEWSKLDVQLVDSGDVAHHPYKEQFANFAECLDAGKEVPNNLKNAVETHRVIFAADKSAETGKPISLSEFRM